MDSLHLPVPLLASRPSPDPNPIPSCPNHLQDQMDSLPYLCRFQYVETADYLSNLTDPLIAAYQNFGGSAAGQVGGGVGVKVWVAGREWAGGRCHLWWRAWRFAPASQLPCLPVPSPPTPHTRTAGSEAA